MVASGGELLKTRSLNSNPILSALPPWKSVLGGPGHWRPISQKSRAEHKALTPPRGRGLAGGAAGSRPQPPSRLSPDPKQVSPGPGFPLPDRENVPFVHAANTALTEPVWGWSR